MLAPALGIMIVHQKGDNTIDKICKRIKKGLQNMLEGIAEENYSLSISLGEGSRHHA